MRRTLSFALACILASIIAAPAQEYVEAWYAGLKQPDDPKVPCCGASDAYYADKVEACTADDGPNCALIAIVTDTRPDSFTTKGGKFIQRPHKPVGTRVVIPRNKIRQRPAENPTDHNIVFFNDYADESGDGYRIVHCWEPAAGI